MQQFARGGRSTGGRSAPAFHRHRRVAGKELVTSVDGSWVLLDPEDFGRYRRGETDPGTPVWTELAAADLLHDAFDPPRVAARMSRRRTFVGSGPNLHVVVVTQRCNETCVYCHASRTGLDAAGADMTFETAERVVERALSSTSPFVTLEFQGGEPLAAFDVVKHVIETALEKNRVASKKLEFTLVSNLSLMDDAKLAYLLEHRVQICTSVDGPAALHDRQRRLPGGSAHAAAARWIRRINAEYERAGLDAGLYRVQALLTTTRDTLPLWKEVVDSYVDLGCTALFLRPLDPFGFAARVGASARIAYPIAEYLEFYARALDYMIALNKSGTQILERFAAIFLTKILDGVDPNYLDIRSPCGAGIGQLAYDHDGKVYTCDEGRMMRAMGDDTFLLGDVHTDALRTMLGHETVRALAVASNLDALPGCASCAYNPYCGVCPVQAQRTQGSIFARAADNALCAVHIGIQDLLFEKVVENDAATMEVLRRWTTSRPREHHIHDGAT